VTKQARIFEAENAPKQDFAMDDVVVRRVFWLFAFVSTALVLVFRTDLPLQLLAPWPFLICFRLVSLSCIKRKLLYFLES
jgi:hypothetical protein